MRQGYSVRYNSTELAIICRAGAVLRMAPATLMRVATVALSKKIVEAVEAASETLQDNDDDLVVSDSE